VQASKLRRLAKEANLPIPTDEEILQKFIKEGKIKAECFYEKTMGPVDPVVKQQRQPSEERSKSRTKPSSTNNNSDTNKEVLDTSNLPTGLKDALNMIKVGQSIGVELKLQDLKPYITQNKTILPFMDLRPSHNLLYTNYKQRDLYAAIKRGQHVIVVGIRGTAKTETIKEALGAELVETDGVKIHHCCGKVDTAIANLKEIKNWLYDRGLPDNMDIHPEDNAHTFLLCNKSVFQAHANTQADIRKYRGNINWIDEAQLMGLQAFAAMEGLFSGVEKFQMILSGNFGEITGGAFENICRSEERKALCERMNIAYFEFDESDIYWVSDKSKSDLRQLMDITLGPNGAASQLDPIWITPEGAKYESTWIQRAYSPMYFPIRMEKVAAGMDWGDDGWTTLVVLGLAADNQIYVLYIWAKKGATTQDVADKIWFAYTEFGAIIAWEKSPSGDFARKDIREKYGNEITFKDSSFSIYKEKYIYFIYRFLSINYIHFIDQMREVSHDPLDQPYVKEDYTQLQILRTELERYCGDKKQDHRHDALAHALYYLVNTNPIIITAIEKVYAQQRGLAHVQTP